MSGPKAQREREKKRERKRCKNVCESSEKRKK